MQPSRRGVLILLLAAPIIVSVQMTLGAYIVAAVMLVAVVWAIAQSKCAPAEIKEEVAVKASAD